MASVFGYRKPNSMSPGRVVQDDVVLFLTGYIRRELEYVAGTLYQGVFVSNRFPPTDDPTPRPKQVIVRNDGGPKTSIITTEPTIGITVLAGEDETHEQQADDLARVVYALVDDCPSADEGNPVAAVLEANGPYPVPDDSGIPRRYMTFTLSCVGRLL